MDKSWINKNRNTTEYVKGVNEFLKFASNGTAKDGTICCPCIKCVNQKRGTMVEVHDHLVQLGFSRGYTYWFAHGESWERTSRTSTSIPIQEGATSNASMGMHTLLHEIFSMHERVIDECELNERTTEPHADAQGESQERQGLNDGTIKFYDMLKDADKPLYEGCTKFSKLTAIVQLYHLKCMGGWSNTSFTWLLKTLNDMLPSDATLPKDTYQAKKYMKELGLGYEKIPTCRNGCMLFWNENENVEVCSTCGESKWKENVMDDNLHPNDNQSTKKGKRKHVKILRWFPLKSRLQRLFMSSKTASHMRWHDEGRTKDGVLRHPADALAWKSFDSQYKDFASETRNVRLALTADGFNPFGNMSTSHSTWPVMLVPYNFPPWMCMKRSSFMLSLLIPGPRAPSFKIDVYLEPLILELKELFDIGLETYDVSSKKMFTMRAALMWTINDFPAYGDLSGWSTKGRFACPCCMGNTWAKWLTYGKKFCYMGHRQFLPLDHMWRMDLDSFDGTYEEKPPPIIASGDEILKQVEGIECIHGIGKRQRMGQAICDESQIWKKRSIFFTLPYWKDNLLRHNLDVMHMEKNVVENIIYTLLNVSTKTKDNYKARLDLQEMGIRHELHPITTSTNKTCLPPACFSMTNKEKEDFLKVIKNVKVPDGYSSNMSRCVKLQQRNIIGMKSHDCHILMQQIMPIALRGSLPKKVASPLIELSSFFREICSKTLRLEDLERLEARIPIILCQLEMIFPPSFFTVMVHLVIHLVNECKLGGPVHYRWMYPTERNMGQFKSYVRNKAAPEGSIAEGYIADECLTFCSRYLDSVVTLFNKPSRNVDDTTGAILNIRLDKKSWTQAHRYVLFNCDEIIPFRTMHKERLKAKNRKTRPSENVINKIHVVEFCDWFRDYVQNMNDTHRSQLSNKIRWLARGPNFEAKEFKRYVVNGMKFRTKEQEQGKTTQNSGVSVNIEEGSTYYGQLTRIIELNYFNEEQYVLFKCDWADITVGKGYKVDEFGFELVNFSRLVHTGEHFSDDPFIMSSQASQVFYVADERNSNWVVVVKTKARDVFDVGEHEMTDDDVDIYCENEPYTLNIEDPTLDAHGNIPFTRNDIEGIIIDTPHGLHDEINREDHGIDND